MYRENAVRTFARKTRKTDGKKKMYKKFQSYRRIISGRPVRIYKRVHETRAEPVSAGEQKKKKKTDVETKEKYYARRPAPGQKPVSCRRVSRVGSAP